MLDKLKDEHARLVFMAVAFICVTVLIGIDKVPSSALEYMLMFTAGAVGGSVAKKVGNDNVQG